MLEDVHEWRGKGATTHCCASASSASRSEAARASSQATRRAIRFSRLSDATSAAALCLTLALAPKVSNACGSPPAHTTCKRQARFLMKECTGPLTTGLQMPLAQGIGARLQDVSNELLIRVSGEVTTTDFCRGAVGHRALPGPLTECCKAPCR